MGNELARKHLKSLSIGTG